MNLLDTTSRMRMFAGPNGSGKTTMKSVIKPSLLGFYINPDELEKEIAEFGFLDTERFGITTDETEILEFFQDSTLLEKVDLLDQAEFLKFNDGKLDFFEVNVNAYFASVAADFIRQKLIISGRSFTFETVMSSPDKINLLEKAQQKGYRTYLYYVATNDPIINLSRVKYRVKIGGHDVPPDKISSRYFRSLDLLDQAIKFSNRAYIFDNSGSGLQWLAEITDAAKIEIKTVNLPAWFKNYVLDKFESKS
jgi:predicted ABC-type ATPase